MIFFTKKTCKFSSSSVIGKRIVFHIGSTIIGPLSPWRSTIWVVVEALVGLDSLILAVGVPQAEAEVGDGPGGRDADPREDDEVERTPGGPLSRVSVFHIPGRWTTSRIYMSLIPGKRTL